MTDIPLRQSTPSEKPLQASKWLQIQALISKNELSHLFNFIEESYQSFFLYYCGSVCDLEKGEFNKNEFLNLYEHYIDHLMNGKCLNEASYRHLFSPTMTVTKDALFTIAIGKDKQIIRVAKPVIQLQAHHFDYSSIDKKFHSMVFGINSISWGIQFSYPQLYQDHLTKQVEVVKKTQAFPNTALFQFLQKWMRQYTIPTPFITEGVLTNVSMRLGKECLSWINCHPQLISKNIVVKN